MKSINKNEKVVQEDVQVNSKNRPALQQMSSNTSDLLVAIMYMSKWGTKYAGGTCCVTSSTHLGTKFSGDSRISREDGGWTGDSIHGWYG